jgi:hypothetical protein
MGGCCGRLLLSARTSDCEEVEMSEVTEMPKGLSWDGWAVIELMGHQRIAGRVSEEEIAGAKLLRVDVPQTEQRGAFTKYYSAGAVYCITPATEEDATKAAEHFAVDAVPPYVLGTLRHPSLMNRISVQDDGDDEDEEGF